MMARLVSACLLGVLACCAGMPAFAQMPGVDSSASAVTSTALDVAAERRRIARQRDHHEAVYQQAERACFARFAVNDCLRQARAQRRVALDELRRQEVILNDMDRQAKALAEIQRIQENTSPERQQERQAQQEQAMQDQQERLKRSQEKAATLAPPAARAASTQQSRPDAAGKDAEALIQQQRYNDKLREAEQHRADKARSLGAGSGSPAKPLPVPDEP